MTSTLELGDSDRGDPDRVKAEQAAAEGGTPIRVVLPYHLRNISQCGAETTVSVAGVVSIDSVLDGLEAKYPPLRGTIRDHVSKKRRPFLRFFACSEDLSHQATSTPLPAAVVEGREPLLVIGAIAGG